MLILGEKRKAIIAKVCSSNFSDYLFGKNNIYENLIEAEYLIDNEKLFLKSRLDDNTLLTTINFTPLWSEDLSLYGYDSDKGNFCAYHPEEDTIEYFGKCEKSLVLFQTFRLWGAFIYSDEELIALGSSLGVDSKKIMEIINSTSDYDMQKKGVREYLKTM